MAMSLERKAERAADRKRDREINKLTSIARSVRVCKFDYLEADLDGCAIGGDLESFNKVIEKLGYRPVRITSNMLNPNSERFCIDINTPTFCDPGCESYHSM